MENDSANDVKKQLVVWLDHVLEGIHKNHIESEHHLEAKVCIISEKDRGKALYDTGVDPTATLLELLGYTDMTCDDHPVIAFTVAGHKAVKIIPDYVTKSAEQKDLATWELKAPAEDVDSKEAVEQLMSYCREPKRQTPIGVLFNGRRLRVFVNSEYPGLGKYKKISEAAALLFDFRHSPVLSLELDASEPGDKSALKPVVDTFISLSRTILSDGAIIYAKRLAEKKLKDVRDGERDRKIVECLQEALASPTDEMIKAIAANIHSWKDFETPPGLDDAVRAWQKRKDNAKRSQTIEAVESQAKQSINGIVRQKVAQICADANKGYDFLVHANVKGLRFRNEGGNGYHPVLQAAGVPNDLFVGGLSTEDAKKVIYRLDAL